MATTFVVVVGGGGIVPVVLVVKASVWCGRNSVRHRRREERFVNRDGRGMLWLLLGK